MYRAEHCWSGIFTSHQIRILAQEIRSLTRNAPPPQTKEFTMLFSLRVAFLVLVALSSAAAANEPSVFYVRDGKPCDVSSPTFAEAIEMAEDGDVIILQNNILESMVINGKSITIRGYGSTVKHTLIENLAADQLVIIEFIMGGWFESTAPALEIRNCIGQVFLDSCTLRGIDYTGPSDPIQATATAVIVQECDNVVFAGGRIEGGFTRSGWPLSPMETPQAMPALESKDSNIYMYLCTVLGGDHQFYLNAGSAHNPLGAPAITIDGGFTFLAGNSTVRGGSTIPLEPDCFPQPCDDLLDETAGIGGSGLVAINDSAVWLLNTSPQGSSGAQDIDFSGTDLSQASTSVSGSLYVSNHLEPHDELFVSVTGTAGSTVKLRYSEGLGTVGSQLDIGSQHLQSPVIELGEGVTDPTGKYQVTFDSSDLGPLPHGKRLYFQAELSNGVDTFITHPNYAIWYEGKIPPPQFLRTPSLEFPSLQDAIDCAKDGDAIEILNQDSGDGEVDNKALTLVSDSANTKFFELLVKNLDANKQVVLRGLNLGFKEASLPSNHMGTLRITDCDGPVLIEDCFILGDTLDANPLETPHVSVAVRVENSLNVSIARSLIEGGSKLTATPGRHALTLVDSSVSVYGSTLIGGTSANGPGQTQDGRPAALVKDGFLFLSGTTLNSVHEEIELFGDNSIWLQDSGSPDLLEKMGSTLNLELLSGTARTVSVTDAPIIVGESAIIEIRGEAFDYVVLGYSMEASSTPILEWNGVVQTAFPFTILSQNFLPPAGILTKSITIGDLPAGLNHIGFVLQALHWDIGGNLFLSSPSYAQLASSN